MGVLGAGGDGSRSDQIGEKDCRRRERGLKLEYQ